LHSARGLEAAFLHHVTMRAGRNSVLPFALSLLLAGCTAGEVATRGGEGTGSEGPDGGAGDPAGGGGGDGEMYDAGTVGSTDCDQPVVSGLPSGEHRAGENCLDCHDGGGSGAPKWTVAGTIYTSLTGGTALPGATIHLTDAGGTDIILVSAQNGNFWTQETVVFPIRVRASSCPDDRPMGGQVLETGASCNQGGCHDSDMRVSLP
jgi:hypothetical protein